MCGAFQEIRWEDYGLVLGDLNSKVGHEECYKSTIENHSLHVNINDNYFINKSTKLIN